MTLSIKSKLLMLLILLLIAFLAGFVPNYQRSRELERQLSESQSRFAELDGRLRLSVLENELGMILVDVLQNNFGTAKERASNFFNRIHETQTATTDDSLQKRMNSALKRRDEIIADLTSLNPQTADKITALYLEFADPSLRSGR